MVLASCSLARPPFLSHSLISLSLSLSLSASDVDDEPEPTEPDYTLRPGLKIDDIGESHAHSRKLMHTWVRWVSVDPSGSSGVHKNKARLVLLVQIVSKRRNRVIHSGPLKSFFFLFYYPQIPQKNSPPASPCLRPKAPKPQSPEAH